MAVALDVLTPAQVAPATTILDAPLIGFGREICGDLAAALRREWLVTNGLGGYASSTLAGINTRRYHGLLVAAHPRHRAERPQPWGAAMRRL
jgi:hypothetical protein